MINLLLVHFDKFPNYFQLFLNSVAINKNLLHIIIITNIDTDSYILPQNTTIIKTTLENIRLKLSEILSEFSGHKNIEPKNLIRHNYKLCDIRPFYGVLFQEYLSHLTEKDYIGYGDCDLIYGKLSNFITDNSYDIIGRSGHLTAVRYRADLISLYKQLDYNKIIHEEYQQIDEKDYYYIIEQAMEKQKYKRFPAEKYICDIIPEPFYNTKTFCDIVLNQEYKKEMVDTHTLFQRVDRIIDNVIFDPSKEILMVNYSDQTNREVLYAHLQKRPLNVHFNEYKDRFVIYNDGFYSKEKQ